ncbi:MAG: hypothetical protein PHO10_05720 [Gemmiger sp.]|nr:hypothetical protein [Gemmiger sp.]
MAPAPTLAAVLADVLWGLGWGLGVWELRDVPGLVFGNGPLRCFVWDVLAFMVAAVLLCGFAAGVSASGPPRWYMVAGMAVGALGWNGAASPFLHRGAATLLHGLTLPLRLADEKLIKPLFAAINARFEKRRARRSAKKLKNSKKVLQKPKRVLYN